MRHYRDTIIRIADRYARAGEDWETSLLTGSPAEIDRDAALSIAAWLDTEADVAWGTDERHHRIAADIRAALDATE